MSVILIDRENNTYHGVAGFEYITDPVLYEKERRKFYKENGLVLPEVKEKREATERMINSAFKYVLSGTSVLLLASILRKII